MSVTKSRNARGSVALGKLGVLSRLINPSQPFQSTFELARGSIVLNADSFSAFLSIFPDDVSLIKADASVFSRIHVDDSFLDAAFSLKSYGGFSYLTVLYTTLLDGAAGVSPELIQRVLPKLTKHETSDGDSSIKWFTQLGIVRGVSLRLLRTQDPLIHSLSLEQKESLVWHLLRSRCMLRSNNAKIAKSIDALQLSEKEFISAVFSIGSDDRNWTVLTNYMGSISLSQNTFDTLYRGFLTSHTWIQAADWSVSHNAHNFLRHVSVDEALRTLKRNVDGLYNDRETSVRSLLKIVATQAPEELLTEILVHKDSWLQKIAIKELERRVQEGQMVSTDSLPQLMHNRRVHPEVRKKIEQVYRKNLEVYADSHLGDDAACEDTSWDMHI